MHWGYLWLKVYGSEPPNVDWSRRLPRAVYIKAYWPPTGPQREEFIAIHLDNLHILFDDPTHCPKDHLINRAISNFRKMLEDPASIQDATYMVIVGGAKKTASQVRWMRDIRERMRKPEQYYNKKRARDDRHMSIGARRGKSGVLVKGAAQLTHITFLISVVVTSTALACIGISFKQASLALASIVMEKVRILDLFSGTGSVKKAAALDSDFECFSLDISDMSTMSARLMY